MNANKIKLEIKRLNEDTVFLNKRARVVNKSKVTLLSVIKFIILLGISYIILGPVINIVANSFYSPTDVYNPSVFLFPLSPTTDNYVLTYSRLEYWKTLGWSLLYVVALTGIQIIITSMAGYGFARFDFPFKKILFACVIITIVLPTHTIMLPLYQHFRNWDIFGIFEATSGNKINLLSSETPMFLMTLLGSGLRSGLFISLDNFLGDYLRRLRKQHLLMGQVWLILILE